ncbi:TlpA family protein disulfide reductase [Actinomadura sp. HBU206391]|uniref:TlpA family protein disulfide reductase n=1 Tax=Actinomadura sp. HBU206391 TaxID=2731692 RepID=UPI0016508ED2|nr:redoxin domain-containing protein [Actinomadura sp. HBU206391]MBC6459437.1 redoxin domain-containing protein [Actinomadura sp. HBU206391]
MRKVAMTMAAAAFFATGCGGSGTDGGTDGETGAGTATGASSPAPAATGAASPGQSPGDGRLRALPAQLRFEGTTLDGRHFTGSDLAERPVVFWFWAPWCPKCASEGPDVAAVAEKYGDRVAFVGVAGLDRSKDQMRRFVSRTGTGDITQLDDRTGRLYKHFKVTSQSSYVFMTRAGSTTRDSGPLSASALEQRVRGLAGG